jgi:light-regulated signal transduction histidine kinase (bacteriophytochrome)
MHSATLELYPTSVVKNDEMVRLCSYMSQGLHALAQPLTIVRSAMAALTTPGVTAVERRRYLELSTQNVERTCSLFECLQDLVIASQIEANCEPMELSQLLADVADDQKTALQASSVELRIAIPDSLPNLRGDAARTMQAISSALKIAASVSSPGDVVELLAKARNGFVELILQNSRINSRPLNSSERLSLALAEANIRSQQGKYDCVEDPLRVFIALPLQDGLRRGAITACCD